MKEYDEISPWISSIVFHASTHKPEARFLDVIGTKGKRLNSFPL
jgi:hypothetical protein